MQGLTNLIERMSFGQQEEKPQPASASSSVLSDSGSSCNSPTSIHDFRDGEDEDMGDRFAQSEAPSPRTFRLRNPNSRTIYMLEQEQEHNRLAANIPN